MKKQWIACFLGVAMAVSVMLTGCGGAGKSTSSTDTQSGKDSRSEQNDPPSVVFVAGQTNDKSLLESAVNGLKMIEEEYGCKTKVIEFGTDTTKLEPTLEDVSDTKWDIVMVGTYSSMEALETVAANHPDQKYMIFDTLMDYTDGKNKNIYSMNYKGNEGAFLAGALAAMVTTSDMPLANPEKHVGWIGGVDNTLINDFVLGFIQGVAEIDPEVKTSVSYVGSFDDAAKGKEMAKVLYDSGCDIVYNGAAQSGMGVLDAAKEAQQYAIGTDSDQAMIFQDDQDKANMILTSQVKRVDNTVKLAVERYMEGTLPFGSGETFGVAEDAIGLADNEYYQKNVPEEFRNRIVDLEEKIVKGELTVDTAYGLTDEEIKTKIAAARPDA